MPSTPLHAPAEFCSTEEAARILDHSPLTLIGWRNQGIGPKFYRHGRKVKYTYSDLTDWLNSNPVSPSAETSPSDPDLAQGSAENFGPEVPPQAGSLRP